MRKRIGLIVLCLMMVCFSLCGAAEGKQKTEITDSQAMILYCPEEGKDDPQFTLYNSSMYEMLISYDF